MKKHQPVDEITYVQGLDYTAVYINGRLAVEGHNPLDVPDVLKALGCKYKEVYPDDDWLYRKRRYPEKLSDVVLQEE